MKRVTVFATLTVALLLPACAPKPGTSARSEEHKPVPVTVAEAKSVSLRRTVSVTGTL